MDELINTNPSCRRLGPYGRCRNTIARKIMENKLRWNMAWIGRKYGANFWKAERGKSYATSHFRACSLWLPYIGSARSVEPALVQSRTIWDLLRRRTIAYMHLRQIYIPGPPSSPRIVSPNRIAGYIYEKLDWDFRNNCNVTCADSIFLGQRT